MLHLRSNYFQSTATITCQECKTIRLNDTIVDSCIPIDPSFESITEGVKKLFQEEILEGIDCDICSKKYATKMQCDTKRNLLLDFSKTEVCTVFIKKNQYNSEGEGNIIDRKNTYIDVLSLNDKYGENDFDLFCMHLPCGY